MISSFYMIILLSMCLINCSASEPFENNSTIMQLVIHAYLQPWFVTKAVKLYISLLYMNVLICPNPDFDVANLC